MRVLGLRRDYPASRDRAFAELVLFSLGLAAWVFHHTVLQEYDPKLIGVVSAVAALYGVVYLIAYRDIHRRWGLSIRGLGTGCLAMTFCLLPMFLSGTMIAVGLGLPRFDLQAGPYLAWCAVQDFIFFAVCARHADEAFQRKWLAGLFAGALFGLSHLPFVAFAWVTFAAGTIWAWVYLKTGCLYPILAAHWVLGILVLTMP